MASSFFALFDDIATLLDDVAALSKVAAQKTTGVLGDDLALNAQQVSGIRAERELPVVWAVAKGSLRNKAILVPLALAISAFLPWAITPLLMLGGAYLCYEGVEKLVHAWLSRKSAGHGHTLARMEAVTAEGIDLVAMESEKVKGAIRTDFILSAEIIVITLGTVAGQPLPAQVMVLSAIALLMTLGVYGIVAAIVKLDDIGLHLQTSSSSRTLRTLGSALLHIAPPLMKTLSFVGTVAMFMVGGGILLHGIPSGAATLHHWTHGLHAIPGAQTLANLGAEILGGILAGSVVLGLVSLVVKLRRKP
ncbi:MAG: hypothetical protein RL318_1202 [Fibrobacterota bacterium]|jgi:predicted DNA repair protein MutK